MVSCLEKQHSPTQFLVTALMLVWSGTIPNKQFQSGELVLEAERVQQHRWGLFLASYSQCLEKFSKVFTSLRHSLYVSAGKENWGKMW